MQPLVVRPGVVKKLKKDLTYFYSWDKMGHV